MKPPIGRPPDQVHSCSPDPVTFRLPFVDSKNALVTINVYNEIISRYIATLRIEPGKDLLASRLPYAITKGEKANIKVLFRIANSSDSLVVTQLMRKSYKKIGKNIYIYIYFSKGLSIDETPSPSSVL
jgi:HKD family nuclease